MKPKQTLIIAGFLICATQLSAQTSPVSTRSLLQDINQAKSKNKYLRNFIKINLTSLALKNYSIQYERVLTKAISVAVAYRTMPATTLPFNNLILNTVGEDQDTKKIIENFRLSNYAFTPEVRFYVGKKGYGRGFYFAPFYRYANFSANNITLDYENNAGATSSIDLPGKLTANTGGLLLGAQWGLGKHMCLDWWILGPHYGSGRGNFSGASTKTLSADEQDDLRDELEDLDIPLTNKTVQVNANGASLKLDGPWGGIRAGISLGVRF